MLAKIVNEREREEVVLVTRNEVIQGETETLLEIHSRRIVVDMKHSFTRV